MHKKHFIALADTIRTFNGWNPDKPFSQPQITALALFCQRQNDEFNMGRWLDYIDGACGPNGGPIKKV